MMRVGVACSPGPDECLSALARGVTVSFATPGRPGTGGRAERRVDSVDGAARALLLCAVEDANAISCGSSV